MTLEILSIISILCGDNLASNRCVLQMYDCVNSKLETQVKDDIRDFKDQPEIVVDCFKKMRGMK